jgi:hypothetical protein
MDRYNIKDIDWVTSRAFSFGGLHAQDNTAIVITKSGLMDLLAEVWQAAQAEQANLIDRIKRFIENFDGEIVAQEKVIAELVEALDSIHDFSHPHIGVGYENITSICNRALAKAKGIA